ncbi:MAG: site-specific integrase [Candidatus Methanomethylophilus sp.]|jgi:integrase/recombinase XerD|nr:site-specific integrase [Methanomethylophilus sp.]MCI2092507.1 site-specific integrase [Methanomethylophilus sp.]
MQRIRKRGIQPDTRSKYLQILGDFLTFWENPVVADMKDLGRIPRYKEPSAPIAALTVDQLQNLMDGSARIEGWPGEVIRGYIAIAFGTGCRPKEVIGAHVADVDVPNRRFYVRHPKGEESWATPQWIPIVREDIIPFIEDFMAARQGLKGPGAVSPYLFCNLMQPKPLCGNTIRKYKERLTEITGIEWKLKDLRSTLTTVTVDNDVTRLKAMSLQLRHSSVRTTERYYARINVSEAIVRGIGDAWKKNPLRKN